MELREDISNVISKEGAEGLDLAFRRCRSALYDAGNCREHYMSGGKWHKLCDIVADEVQSAYVTGYNDAIHHADEVIDKLFSEKTDQVD